MPKRNPLYALAEPDIVTRAFCVKRLERAPVEIEAVLCDLEVQRSDGAVALVIVGDVVCLWLADFLIAGAEQDGASQNALEWP